MLYLIGLQHKKRQISSGICRFYKRDVKKDES